MGRLENAAFANQIGTIVGFETAWEAFSNNDPAILVNKAQSLGIDATEFIETLEAKNYDDQYKSGTSNYFNIQRRVLSMGASASLNEDQKQNLLLHTITTSAMLEKGIEYQGEAVIPEYYYSQKTNESVRTM